MLTLAEAFPTRLAGVIRAPDAETARRACLAAVEGGVATLEVTMTVPGALDALRALVRTAGVPVGVGTVLAAGQVAPAVAAGAAFVVTPVLVPEVAEACRKEGVLCVLGALTPTEIHAASLAGADMVKVFPVHAAGGPAYVRSLRGPLPDIPLWVSGGVALDEIEEYMRVGVEAVGLTTTLFPAELLRAADYAAITALARRAAAASAAGRRP